MEKLGMVLNSKQKSIEIDEIDLPMRNILDIQLPNKVYQMYKNTEPLSTADLTKRAVKILDAKYEKADLNGIVEKCDHLDAEQKKQSVADSYKI